MKLLTILFALSFCLQANSLTCWKCSEICSDKRHVKNFNDCSGCDWNSKETCGEGVSHCIKINFPNGSKWSNFVIQLLLYLYFLQLSQDLVLTLPSSLKLWTEFITKVAQKEIALNNPMQLVVQSKPWWMMMVLLFSVLVREIFAMKVPRLSQLASFWSHWQCLEQYFIKDASDCVIFVNDFMNDKSKIYFLVYGKET